MPHLKSVSRKDIAQSIRRYRLEAGFTQAALARGISTQFNLHISEGQIVDMESGAYSIAATALYRVAATLGVPVEKFFGLRNEFAALRGKVKVAQTWEELKADRE